MTRHPIAARVLKNRNLMMLGFSLTEIKGMSAREEETWLFVLECEARKRKIKELEQESKFKAMAGF